MRSAATGHNFSIVCHQRDIILSLFCIIIKHETGVCIWIQVWSVSIHTQTTHACQPADNTRRCLSAPPSSLSNAVRFCRTSAGNVFLRNRAWLFEAQNMNLIRVISKKDNTNDSQIAQRSLFHIVHIIIIPLSQF